MTAGTIAYARAGQARSPIRAPRGPDPAPQAPSPLVEREWALSARQVAVLVAIVIGLAQVIGFVVR